MDARRRRLFQFGGGIVVVAIVAVVIALATADEDAGGEDPLDGTQAVETLFAGIPQRGDTLGAKTDYTLVEYADLQCPACKAYADAVTPSIVRDLVRTGRLRLRVRPFQFVGPDSGPAAQYALAAGRQGKLFQFVELWYANQGVENSGYVDDDFARRIAGGVQRLDPAQLIADTTGEAATTGVNRNAADFQAAGLGATPSFVLVGPGGRAQPVELPPDGDAAVRTLTGLIG